MTDAKREQNLQALPLRVRWLLDQLDPEAAEALTGEVLDSAIRIGQGEDAVARVVESVRQKTFHRLQREASSPRHARTTAALKELAHADRSDPRIAHQFAEWAVWVAGQTTEQERERARRMKEEASLRRQAPTQAQRKMLLQLGDREPPQNLLEADRRIRDLLAREREASRPVGTQAGPRRT